MSGQRRPFIFKVPAELAEEGIGEFYHGWQWWDPTSESIELSFSEATSISPWILALFSAHMVWLNEVRKKRVSFN